MWGGAAKPCLSKARDLQTIRDFMLIVCLQAKPSPSTGTSSDSGSGSSGWSASAQLQSGDVLVVRIDTLPLLASNDTR